VLENIKAVWGRLNGFQRAGLLAGVVLIVGICVYLGWWASRDRYQVLFADLDPQDGSTMIGELDRMKVPYRLADKGNTILVDQDQVYKTRLQLMGKGLTLKGTVGFEIFNNAEFGVTEFAQKVNYLRAMQGELARTIMGFEEVKFARVHLVLPENGLFKKGGVKPKASISLTMKDGAHLRPEQIIGVQRLVAASVSEIEPSAVTVLDQQGVALSRAAVQPDSDLDSGMGKLEAKKQTETYLSRKVAEILDKTYGPGQAVVSVDVVLNQDQVRMSREDILPATRRDGEAIGVVARKRSQSPGLQLHKEYDLQVPAEAARDAGRLAGANSTEVEYQNGRKVEQVVTTPGGIRRVSVGVLVPGEIDRLQMDRLAKVISMAVGLNPDRGDAIAVFSMDQMMNRQAAAGGSPPDVPAAPAAQGAATVAAAGREPDVSKFIILAVGIGALIVVLLLAIMRRRGRSEDQTGLSNEAERQRVLQQIRQWMGPAPDAGHRAQGT